MPSTFTLESDAQPLDATAQAESTETPSYRIQNSQAACTGAAAGQTARAGAMAGQDHHPGATLGQCHA